MARPVRNENLTVTAARERWPLQGEFRISRAVKREANVVVATVGDGIHQGRGECVPYARYGETVESILGELSGVRALSVREALDVDCANRLLPAGAGRNALDCALWDWRAQALGRTVWEQLRLPGPSPTATAYTLGIASPDEMCERARAHRHRPLLKIKLGGDDAASDGDRLRAVRDGAPDAELIVDANEGWTPARLEALLPVADDVGVSMIEQPLAAGRDEALLGLDSPVPIGADESAHLPRELPALRGKYQVVNIKLDKTGGLTTALAMAMAARGQGFDVMIGCMVATSLAMAPALLLAGFARFVDLDGPLLLRKDREPGLNYRDSLIEWPNERIWGTPSSG
ncbi:MAG: dipeptide epimerase [Gammaproteobacteria bacterium]|nr:dipeptide epimerase [Gammaproteobacteria bacterium]